MIKDVLVVFTAGALTFLLLFALAALLLKQLDTARIGRRAYATFGVIESIQGWLAAFVAIRFIANIRRSLSMPVLHLSDVAPHVFASRLFAIFVVLILEPFLAERLCHAIWASFAHPFALGLGINVGQLLVVAMHGQLWLKPIHITLLTWPGYNKAKEIKDPLEVSGIELLVLEAERDALLEVHKALRAGSDEHQIHALVIDQERVRALQANCSRLKVPKLGKELDEFCKSVTGLPEHFLPLRFGFNGICWEDPRNLDGSKRTHIEKLTDSKNSAPQKWTKNYLLLLEASQGSQYKWVGYFDWWFLQMLLHVKLSLAANEVHVRPDELASFLKFNSAGFLDTSASSDAQRVWTTAAQLLSALRNGGKSYDNSIDMSADYLCATDTSPHLFIGPGDSFSDPREAQDGEQQSWGFLGDAGGLIWIEGLVLPFPKNTMRDDAKAGALTETEERLMTTLTSRFAQVSICNTHFQSKAGTRAVFYANSPQFFFQSSRLPDHKEARYSSVAVSRQLAQLTDSVFQADPTTDLFTKLNKSLTTGALWLRPDPQSFIESNWIVAYNRILH